MDVTSILDSLNDAQREAVTAPVDARLVLAGAGSGKTRVLVHRIAWLVQFEQMSSYAIMAVTFTNKAAAEMRGRIQALLHVPPRGMWMGTFHGLAHRLLRAHWQAAELPENFQILDSDDQLRIIKRIMKAMQLDDKKWPPRQAQWYINSKKDEGLRARHIDPGYDSFERTMVDVYQRYQEYCDNVGVVDFGELLLRAHELLLKHQDILQHYRNRFRYILVDEFQDTNAIQYAWLRLLCGDEPKLMVVGDDDQSIYGWRGARIENIRQFSNDFPSAKTIKLEENYRSTANILHAANAVIANNPDRLGKTLRTSGAAGSAIQLFAAINEMDEARFVSNQINTLHKQGMPRGEMAILYRSNAQSRVLEEAMLRSNIPYRIYGGQRFFERLEIKNALAYLRMASTPHDNTAFERIINVPPRGIGEKSVEKLREVARHQQCSLWIALQNSVATKSIGGKAGKSMAEFIELINGLQASAETVKLDELVEQMLVATDLIEHHRKEKGEKGQSRVENLEELVSACTHFDPSSSSVDEDNSDMSTLDVFLAHVALEAGEEQSSDTQDSVQMMTLHSAKGLEFKQVFLVGMEDGLFPHKMSIEEGNIEEERRLCYVGITRAMQNLCLSYAETRNLYGSETYNRPSRFLREIPKELLQEVRLGGTVSRPVQQRAKPNAGHGFNIGQSVHHDVFGEGVVINYEGDGAQARVQVNFATEGSKWLMLAYAKLKAC